MIEFLSDLIHEIGNEVHVTKDDLIAGSGGIFTGGIWGFTQNEVAGIMTILIGSVIILHKFILIFCVLHKHLLETRQLKKTESNAVSK